MEKMKLKSMGLNERNRKVALKRWRRILKSRTETIRKNTKDYPHLKARIIAYLMGDGAVCVRKEKNGDQHHSISFYPDDKHMLQAFLEAFKIIYSQQPRIRNHGKYFSVILESKPVTLDLLRHGSFRSLEWRIPDFKEKKYKKEWLRAFYDCEGYIGPRIIAVQSVNKTGLKQVSDLLVEFGISCKMYSYERQQKTWNMNFLLYITKLEDRRRFLNEVGFNHRRKLQKLQQFAGVAQPGTAADKKPNLESG